MIKQRLGCAEASAWWLIAISEFAGKNATFNTEQPPVMNAFMPCGSISHLMPVTSLQDLGPQAFFLICELLIVKCNIHASGLTVQTRKSPFGTWAQKRRKPKSRCMEAVRQLLFDKSNRIPPRSRPWRWYKMVCCHDGQELRTRLCTSEG